MVDRECRNRLINAITRYAGEEITAFAFDDEISEIETKDKTVRHIVKLLWLHYDDCKDHLAGLSKGEWDYFQRLVLLLHSEAEIHTVSERRWSLRQLAAVVSLAAFGWIVYQLGIGQHLIAFAFLFGPISIGISYWQRHSEAKRQTERPELFPFNAVSQLRRIRRTVPGFSKKRRPAETKIRNVHSALGVVAAYLNTYALWSFFSPLILLLQALPEKAATLQIQENAELATT